MLSNKSAVSWEEGQSYFQAMRLDTRVESNYSGGNGNRGEIGFAYFLAILPFYEKSCIWLFIWMPQKCCV